MKINYIPSGFKYTSSVKLKTLILNRKNKTKYYDVYLILRNIVRDYTVKRALDNNSFISEPLAGRSNCAQLRQFWAKKHLPYSNYLCDVTGMTEERYSF